MNAADTPRAPVTIDAIIEQVAIAWEVGEHDICSPRRSTEVCAARYAIAGLALAFTRKTHAQIARAMGNRDHTMTGYYRERCRELMQSDEEFVARMSIARGFILGSTRKAAQQATEGIDAAAVARRVAASWMRAPIGVSAREVRAMALYILDLEEALQKKQQEKINV